MEKFRDIKQKTTKSMNHEEFFILFRMWNECFNKGVSLQSNENKNYLPEENNEEIEIDVQLVINGSLSLIK